MHLTQANAFSLDLRTSSHLLQLNLHDAGICLTLIFYIMNYKDALKIAKVSIKTARQQFGIASDILDEHTSENARELWSILNAIESMLFNLHYYIMDKFNEEENESK